MQAKCLLLFLLFLSYSEAGTYSYDAVVGKHSDVINDTLTFYGIYAVREEFWDPPKHINLNGVGKKRDYVVFFGSDSDRPLEYSCGNSCKVYLKQTSIGPSSVTLSASVKLFAPPPASTGVLQLCTGPGNLFWKRPLVAEANITCIAWSRSFWPRVGGYLIQPNHYVEDSVALDVHTWFMTKMNYDQMRENGVTQVLVPVFENKYWLPIVTSFYHGHKFKNVKCYFKSSFDAERVKDNQKKIKYGYSLVYKYTNFVEALEESSGLYTVTCLGKNWDEFAPRNWTVKLSKSLNITFIKGPMVIISGLVGNTVFLSDHNSFNITLYSTSPVTTFKMERSDGLSSEGQPIVTRLVTRNAYNLLSVYRVKIPTATEGIRAIYTLTVVNEDQESITQNVGIVKPRGMHVSVYPMETIASEGDRLTFDCTVSGDTITQIKWTRDYEQSKAPLLNTEYISDGKGLRLTLINARQEHSGTYVCTASDQTNNTKRGSVSLAVWPRGSWLAGVTPLQQHSLNMSQGEVLTEWTLEQPYLSTSSILLAVITLLMGALMMTACVVAGAYYIYQLISSSPEDLDTPKAPPPPTEQSAEELWEMVRKQSLQMDRVLSLTKTTSKQKDVQEAITDKTNDQRLSEGVHKSKHKQKKSKRDQTDKEITQEDEQSRRDKRRHRKQKDGEHSKPKRTRDDVKPPQEKNGERSKAKRTRDDAKPPQEKDGEQSKARRKEKARERDEPPRSPKSGKDNKYSSKQT